MRRARETIPNAALAKLKREWLTQFDAIKRTATDKIVNTFLNLRASFLSSLGKIKNNGPVVQDLIEELIIAVPRELRHASENIAHAPYSRCKFIANQSIDLCAN